MMGAAREKDQADFDLERFIDMFDEAMTSQDPRVIDTLRSLMMIVTLTRPESATVPIDRNRGPLRRLFEDVNHLNRRLHTLEEELRSLGKYIMREQEHVDVKYPYEKYVMQDHIAVVMDQDQYLQIEKEIK